MNILSMENEFYPQAMNLNIFMQQIISISYLLFFFAKEHYYFQFYSVLFCFLSSFTSKTRFIFIFQISILPYSFGAPCHIQTTRIWDARLKASLDVMLMTESLVETFCNYGTEPFSKDINSYIKMSVGFEASCSS